jgi:hypothetical protein
MPSCIGCGAKETSYDPCTCPPPCDRCDELAERLALADKILDLLTAYNVGMSFLSEERVAPLWEAYHGKS